MQSETVTFAARREPVRKNPLQILHRRIPTPLSATAISTRFPFTERMLKVICLSVRPLSSSAHFAFWIKFTRICSNLCFSTLMAGTSR